MYGEAGNHHKALEYREKALKSLLQLFGDNHHHTAIAYSNVGYAYGALGSYPKALEYHEKAVSIVLKHKDRTRIIGELVKFLQKMGKSEEDVIAYLQKMSWPVK